MLSELKKIGNDYRAALGGSRKQIVPPYGLKRRFSVFVSFEFQLVFFFRIYSEVYRSPAFSFLGLLLYFFSKYLFKCDIHPGASIASGFHVVHGFGVIVGSDAVVGKDVCLFDGVSLGKKNVGEIDQMPHLGDNVIVGSGAKILGGVTLLSNSIVGANSVVIHDCSVEGAILVGAPARNVCTNKDV